jgi:acetyl esterase/lipase
VLALFLVVAGTLSCAHAPPAPVTWKQIAAMPQPPADHVIPYGDDSLAFGELRLPTGAGPHPLVILIHGGCWRSQYDLHHVAPLGAALTRRGVAVWTIEYRRIGDAGGGWPGTFEDVARGADHVRELARKFPLDLERVVLVGHSAGGHLALWLAARRHLPAGSPLAVDPLPVRGVVGLAAISDLRAYGAGAGYCNESVGLLLGGTPAEVPDRYAQASPTELPPAGVPLRLVHGTGDTVVPLEQSRAFAARLGGEARYVPIEGAGHFDLIAPTSSAWATVEREIVSLVSDR